MLLFTRRFHEGLTSGAITLTFRRWAKPKVKPGGRYRCHPIGVLAVDGIAQVLAGSIADDDARRAGFVDAAELRAFLDCEDDAPIYRVELRHDGDGDRVPIALSDQLTAEDVKDIRARLAKLDANGLWTKKTLSLIERRPRIAASKLAAELGRDTAPFKADVVKLKKLGLTQSFEVGYELSPRGKAFRKRR